MLQITLRRAATLLVSLAGLAACHADSTAPRTAPMSARAYSTTPSGNTIYRDAQTVPFTTGVYASCANGGQGEVLDINGVMQYAGHWISTNQGERVHFMVFSTFNGSAVGWDTGETYDVTTRELSEGNTSYGSDGILDSGEQLQRIDMSLKSQSTGAVIDIVLVGQFVQTATGEYVIDGWQGTARCN